MAVQRSTVRDSWNVQLTRAKDPEPELKSLEVIRQGRVAGVLGTHRLHDGDDLRKPRSQDWSAPVSKGWGPSNAKKVEVSRAVASFHADGFDVRRRAPVDLSGGLKTHVGAQPSASRAPTLPIAGFLASIADLGMSV